VVVAGWRLVALCVSAGALFYGAFKGGAVALVASGIRFGGVRLESTLRRVN